VSICGGCEDRALDNLFYSSKSPEETPFLEELMGIPEQNKAVSVVITMTRAPEDPASWTGLRGRLDEGL